MRDESRRYRGARLLQMARDAIDASAGVTIYDLMKRLDVKRAAAQRLLAALRGSGYAFRQEREGKVIVYRKPASTGRPALPLTVSQLVALSVVRQELKALAGTGLDKTFEDLCRRFELAIADPKYTAALNLDGRIYTVPGPQPMLPISPEQMNEILAAIFACERLEITTRKRDKGRRTFRVEPLTLMLHERIPYLAAFSETHDKLLTFGCDTIVEVKRREGDRFERPEGYHPEQLVEGAFGLMRGPEQRVSVRFDKEVARYVTRMVWHPTQTITEIGDGAVELRMKVRGLEELTNRLLTFRQHFTVTAPVALKKEMRAIGDGIVRRHREERPWQRRRGAKAGARVPDAGEVGDGK